MRKNCRKSFKHFLFYHLTYLSLNLGKISPVETVITQLCGERGNKNISIEGSFMIAVPVGYGRLALKTIILHFTLLFFNF